MGYGPNYLISRSLRYPTKLGLVSVSSPSAFLVSSDARNSFVALEQAIDLNVTGLKPNTVHRVYFNGIDVTSRCKQQGTNIGEGLISSVFNYLFQEGSISFTFYYQSTITPTTPVEVAAAEAAMIAGTKTLKIVSSDESSVAEIQLTLPRYAWEEAQILTKKKPSVTDVASTISYTEVSKQALQGPYFTPPSYSYIQTFYADPESVGNTGEIALTSIDLFFKRKPSQTNNASGISNAGVTVAICEVENDSPVLSKTYTQSLTYKQYGMVYSYADASSSTTFGFREPLKLATGKFYGIVIIFEDPGYELWSNKVGDKLVGTNTPSAGSNSNKDGKLFRRTNAGVFNAISDTDIKFNARCAKYVVSNDKKIFVNKNYEFLTVDKISGTFIGGEYVYQDTSPAAGFLTLVKGANTISGYSGTDFNTLTVGSPIVLVSGVRSQIVSISEIANNSNISVNGIIEFSNTAARYIASTPMGRLANYDIINDKMVISNSTANSDVVFQTSETIVGTTSQARSSIISIDNLNVDRVRLKGSVRTPATGIIDTNIKFASKGAISGVIEYIDNNKDNIKLNGLTATDISKYDAYILSRTNEINNASLYSNSDLLISNKSVKVEADFSVLGTGEIYSSPSLENSVLDLYAIENLSSVTSSVADGNDILIDTEVTGNGIAVSKHISTKVNFSNNRLAEDVRMFMVAYRPLGTEINCYVRLYNSKDPESFDDKAWSPLELVSNINKYSSSDDNTDFIEYELGIPAFSESYRTLPGTFTAALNNATITANGTDQIASYVSANDVIKIYNPLFPLDNYQVATVLSKTTTDITLGKPIETTNVQGSGLKVDVVKYPTAAFNNINNTNIVRYFNNARSEFDGFDTMQIKIVFLSDSTYRVPRIDQIQVLGVSA
jgi:hypothetical protein